MCCCVRIECTTIFVFFFLFCFRLAFSIARKLFLSSLFGPRVFNGYMWFTFVASALVTFVCCTHTDTHLHDRVCRAADDTHPSDMWSHSTVVQHRISIFFVVKCVCFGNFTFHVARPQKNDTKKYTIPFYLRITEILYRLFGLLGMGNHVNIFIWSVLWVLGQIVELALAESH